MKKVLAITLILFIIAGYVPKVSAAAPDTKLPEVTFATPPKVKYTTSDFVSIFVGAANYKGKVEYKLVVYNATLKKSSVIFPNPINQDYSISGSGKKSITGETAYYVYYRASKYGAGTCYLYAYVRRVGSKVKYDSYVVSKPFEVIQGENLTNKPTTPQTVETKPIVTGVDLRPHIPDNWGGQVIISKNKDTYITDAQITANTDLYLGFAFGNKGNTTISTGITHEIYIDGVKKKDFEYTKEVVPDCYYWYCNVPIGSLSEGSHTIKVVADSGLKIAETDENNNFYEIVITVVPDDPARIKTIDDLEDYLNKNFKELETPMGKWTFETEIKENSSSIFPEDLWLMTDYVGLSPYDIRYSIKYTQQQKDETVMLLKDFQTRIANVVMMAFPSKKVRGGFYSWYYKYKYIREGYVATTFLSWTNYTGDYAFGNLFDASSDRYNNTQITYFHFVKGDDYEF